MKRHSNMQAHSDGWALDQGADREKAGRDSSEGKDSQYTSTASSQANQPIVDSGLSMTISPSYVNLANLALEGDLLRHLQSKSCRSHAASDAGPGLVSSTTENDETKPCGVSAPEQPVPTLFDVALPLVRQGYVAAVDDSFTRCFKSKKRVHWNWNCYLIPAWIIGLALRYLILFPLRLMCLALGFAIMAVLFPIAKMCRVCLPMRLTSRWETLLIQMLASAFVASWSGVIRIHGFRPKPRPGTKAGVFVANHSSMIDFIILLQSHPYAVVGQKHNGWVGFLQDHMLSSLKCVWFDRGESKDKKAAADRLQKHVADASNADFPILVFPEGTCVNNEYVVQFKKFVFELGVPIHPIAIKYSKVFVDAYWNSREQSFAQHLCRLMTSWAVVCDIWFMDPQELRPGETGAQFSTRVQHMIANRAGLKPVPWDGYMKYWRPGERFITARQRSVAEDICKSEDLPMSPLPSNRLEAGEAAAAGAGAPSAPGLVGEPSLSASSTQLSRFDGQADAAVSAPLPSSAEEPVPEAVPSRAESPETEPWHGSSSSAGHSPLLLSAALAAAAQRRAGTPYRSSLYTGYKVSPDADEEEEEEEREGGPGLPDEVGHTEILPLNDDRRGSAETDEGMSDSGEGRGASLGMRRPPPVPAPVQAKLSPLSYTYGRSGGGQIAAAGSSPISATTARATPNRRSPPPGTMVGRGVTSQSPLAVNYGN